jgi:tRNA(Ile)-lysidine synthase
MLAFRRHELETYLSSRKLDYRHDPSNQSMSHRRNRIRQQLLPMLRQEFQPQVDQAILRLADAAKEHADYIRRAARRLERTAVEQSEPERLLLDRNQLMTKPPLLIRSLLRQLIRKHRWPRQQLTAKHYHRLVAMLRTGKPRVNQLPAGITARVRSVKGKKVLELCYRETVSPEKLQ